MNIKDTFIKALPFLAAAALSVSVAGVALAQSGDCDPAAGDGLGSLVGQVPGNPGGAVLGTPCDADKTPRSTVHSKAPTVRPGPWQITGDAASSAYGTTPERYGVTKVQAIPGQLEFDVRDMQYPLPGGVGTQIVATKDHGNITMPDGREVPGAKPLDDFLRKAEGLGADDPVYALAGFTHFENNEGGYKELGGPLVKTEMSQTHLAAYIGANAKGTPFTDGGPETTNSPDDYHSSRWHNKGYPANIYVVRSDMDADGDMDSTDQVVLNKNAHNTLGILGHGVKFPGDYKNDPLSHAKSLKTSLEFYKAWLKNPDDPFFNIRANKLYCAELQTLALNLALNVPHNEAAFKRIFGDEGPELLELAKKRFAERRNGAELYETDFVPLFDRTPGLNLSDDKPIIDQLSEDQVGVGLAWMPQTTADIMTNFIETYASLPEVGGPVSVSMVAGFKDLIQQRTGISTQEYMGFAVPAMQQIMIADALTQPFAGNPDAFKEYATKTTGALYVALGGEKADLAPGATPNPEILGLAKTIMEPVSANAREIMGCAGASGMDREQAHSWMRQSLKPILTQARGASISNSGAARYFSAPAVPHRISTGQWQSHPDVKITPVATAMDASELEYKDGQDFVYPEVGTSGGSSQGDGSVGSSPSGPTPSVDPVPTDIGGDDGDDDKNRASQPDRRAEAGSSDEKSNG